MLSYIIFLTCLADVAMIATSQDTCTKKESTQAAMPQLETHPELHALRIAKSSLKYVLYSGKDSFLAGG
jgi:hypothetical protein